MFSGEFDEFCTLKPAFWSVRAAAMPEIPPPITITEGGFCSLFMREINFPKQEKKPATSISLTVSSRRGDET